MNEDKINSGQKSRFRYKQSKVNFEKDDEEIPPHKIIQSDLPLKDNDFLSKHAKTEIGSYELYFPFEPYES